MWSSYLLGSTEESGDDGGLQPQLSTGSDDSSAYPGYLVNIKDDRIIVRGVWDVMPTLGMSPSPRVGASLLGTRESALFLFGGFSLSNAEFLGDLWLLDLHTDTWRSITDEGPPPNASLISFTPPASPVPGPMPRASHSAVHLGDSMVIFGGYNDHLVLDDVCIFSFSTMRWESWRIAQGPSPGARKGHCAVVYRDAMYVYGGEGPDGTIYRDLWVLENSEEILLPGIDGESTKVWRWQCLGESDFALTDHAAVVHGETMYVFGGVVPSGPAYSASEALWAYSFTSMTWTPITGSGSMFVAPRCKHTMTLVGNFLVIIGGCGLVGPDDYVTHVTVFNVETQTWDVIRPENSPSSSSFSTLAISSTSTSSLQSSTGDEVSASALHQSLTQLAKEGKTSRSRGARGHRRTSSGGGVRKWVYASAEPVSEEATPVVSVTSSMVLRQLPNQNEQRGIGCRIGHCSVRHPQRGSTVILFGGKSLDYWDPGCYLLDLSFSLAEIHANHDAAGQVLPIILEPYGLSSSERKGLLDSISSTASGKSQISLVSLTTTQSESESSYPASGAGDMRSLDPRVIPPEFLDPVTKKIMQDPIIAPDGKTYDSMSIRSGLVQPLPSTPASNSNSTILLPNVALRESIRQFSLWKQREASRELQGSVEVPQQLDDVGHGFSPASSSTMYQNVPEADAMGHSNPQVGLSNQGATQQQQQQQQSTMHPQTPRDHSSSVTSSSNTQEQQETTSFKPFRWNKGHQLGSGAFGTVFVAMNLETGKFCAAKQVHLGSALHTDDKALSVLQNEIDLLSRLHHPHIVSYIGCERTTEDVFTVFMEYVPGGDIASVLKTYGAFTIPVIVSYTRQILEGLEYLHANKIIHRDIKGANVLLTIDGFAKLSDFGVSSVSRAVSSKHTWSVVGSPYWMAPEVVKAEGAVFASDIWSLGCTVFEMATTKPPWSHLEPMAAIFHVGSRGTLPELPEFLGEVGHAFIFACSKYEVKDRPSATELLKHPFLQLDARRR